MDRGAPGGVLLCHRRRPRFQRRVAARPRSGSHVGRRDRRRWRVARRGSEDPRRRHYWRWRDRRCGGRRPQRGASRRDRGGHPGPDRDNVKDGAHMTDAAGRTASCTSPSLRPSGWKDRDPGVKRLSPWIPRLDPRASRSAGQSAQEGLSEETLEIVRGRQQYLQVEVRSSKTLHAI